MHVHVSYLLILLELIHCKKACCTSQYLSFACLNQLKCYLSCTHTCLMCHFILSLSMSAHFKNPTCSTFLAYTWLHCPATTYCTHALSHPYTFVTFDKLTMFIHFIHNVVFLFACTNPNRILSIPTPSLSELSPLGASFSLNTPLVSRLLSSLSENLDLNSRSFTTWRHSIKQA